MPDLLPGPRWALTPPFHPYPPPSFRASAWRSALCGTFPGVAPAGRYPAPFIHGARTFLPAFARRPSGRLARERWHSRGAKSTGAWRPGHRLVLPGTADSAKWIEGLHSEWREVADVAGDDRQTMHLGRSRDHGILNERFRSPMHQARPGAKARAVAWVESEIDEFIEIGRASCRERV